ncbi:hypothetical protein GQ54DRAFT_336560 [Martensiomyces pterosporus]|nr:hypothetical protein GQ54DRAFT_336560 [Martensiomyces pterosporus]
MSVLNLEANWLERTELDDWESLLCLVCWLATFGINKEDRKSVRSGGKDLRGFRIYGWRHGLISSIPENKRDHLYSLNQFGHNIVEEFAFSGPAVSAEPNYNALAKVAVALYMALFQNKDIDKKYRGTRAGFSLASFVAEDQSSLADNLSSMSMAEPTDPFILRTEKGVRETIVKNLNDVLQGAAKIRGTA